MNSPSSRGSFLLFGCALCAVTTASFAGVLDFLFGKPDIEVITVTDMTPEGRMVTPATPGNPTYYLPVSMGFQDIGGIVAGEKIPPKAEMLNGITNTLAAQGYLPITDTSPDASIVLVMTWGTLYTDVDFGFDPDAPPRVMNRQQILNFLGGKKLGFSDSDFDPLTAPMAGLTFRDADARDFLEMAEEDFYMAVVAAYDLAAMKEGKKKLLWMTRISCPSRRYWLAEVFPTMMTIAGPNFGRETTKPVWVNASDRFKADVKIGEVELMNYLDGSEVQVVEPKIDLKDTKKKKK